MFPTIHRFMEELLSPRTSLRTLSEARFAQDGTGALLLERTTLFAEAQCTLGDRRLRLFCPLSPLAHRLAETTAQRLKYHPAEFLLPWRMLRGEFTDTSAEYSAPCTAFRNHLWVGHMFEQMICVEDAEGYGYVDTQNRYLIAPQYRWANDFHEGRAEVQTADGRMGLIDKTGRYVLEPHYEIVEYDDRTGRLLARFDGRWAAFDYEGRQLTEFGAVEP